MNAFARAIVAVWVFVLAAAVSADAQPMPGDVPPLTLEELERRALDQNPTLRQAEAGIELARGRARQARLLPNPIVGYVGEEISPGPTIRGGEHGVFVEQTIPLGGKLRLSRQIFEREVSQAEAVRDLQRVRIQGAVRVLFFQALAVERRVQVSDRLSQLASEAVDITRQLYNVGAADRPDVLESEIEARRAQLDLLRARNGRFAIWRRLAAVVGDPTLTPRSLAGSIELAIPELERDTALVELRARSPEVAAARADLDRARAIVARARREPYPDLFVRGGPMYNRELLDIAPAGDRRPVGWEASIEAGITIPLFNRNQGGVAAARSDVTRAEAELRRLELVIESRFAGAWDEYLTALRSAEVYRNDVLPRAEEGFRLYLARYREMGAAYPQVLIARRTMFQVNDEYLLALDEAWRSALRIQGFLVDEGLGAPARPGELDLGQPTGMELSAPGAMRAGRER